MYRFTFMAEELPTTLAPSDDLPQSLSVRVDFIAEGLDAVLFTFQDFLKGVGYNPGEIVEIDDDGDVINRSSLYKRQPCDCGICQGS